MSLFTRIRDTVTNPSTIIGAGLGGLAGGAIGSTAVGNAVTGQPIGLGMTGAAGLDLAGLGGGLALGGSLGAGAGLASQGLGMAGAGGASGAGGAGGASGAGGGVLDTLGNLSPAILAGVLGNSQRQDVMGQVGKINTLGDQLGDQSGAYLKAITDPYDQQTGLGRTSLQNALVQRGVGGSSFGNQQLDNYDYMRGLGRQDIGTKAQVGLGSLQGGLYGNALQGIIGANQGYNQLLGAGLGASGSLMNRSGGSGLNLGSLSGISNLFGNGLSSVGGALGNLFGTNTNTGGAFGLPELPLPSDQDLQGLFGNTGGLFDIGGGLG